MLILGIKRSFRLPVYQYFGIIWQSPNAPDLDTAFVRPELSASITARTRESGNSFRADSVAHIWYISSVSHGYFIEYVYR